ncbi:MAG: rhodanese-like domain-containing protein [Bacteroidota bacterium]|nr:rhodanese-like domain-containing protein [Bacteroidota bacterium]
MLLLLPMDLTQQEWLSRLKKDSNSLIIDVRTDREYQEGHIANSVLIDITKMETFLEKIKSLDKSLQYYIYCRSGQRSSKACYLMAQVGIKNNFNLLGGILEWEGDLIK